MDKLAVRKESTPEAKKLAVEKTLIQGDLSELSSESRVAYYMQTCHSLGLNPWTKPFEYIELDGKLKLYPKKEALEQIRNQRSVSLQIINRQERDGMFIVTVRAELPNGRKDEAIGVSCIEKEGGEWKTAKSGTRYFEGNGQFKKLSGKDLANAMMRAETKAKRRVTLSICGLGFWEEMETDNFKKVEINDDLPTPDIDSIVDAEYDNIDDSDIHAESSKATKTEPPAMTDDEFQALKDEIDRIVTYCPEDMKKEWDTNKKSKSVSIMKWIKEQAKTRYLRYARLTPDEIAFAAQEIEQAYGAGEELKAFGEFVERGEWWQAIILSEKAAVLVRDTKPQFEAAGPDIGDGENMTIGN